MKNVLILNQAHTTNLGDIAIGESLSSWIRENAWNPITIPFWDERSIFKSLSYTKLSGLIKSFPFASNIVIGKWVKANIEKILASNTIDCVICGGGELFCSHRGFNAAFYCWVKEFVKRNIPVCVIGVSGDKNLSSVQIKRNKVALAQCFLVSVRDKDSVSVFKELYDISADYAPDSVFRLDKYDRSKINTGGLVCVPVGLNSCEISDVDFYYYKIKNVPNVNRIVFTSTEERDQSYSKKLCEDINHKYNEKYVFVPYVDLQSFRNVLDNADYVVSARMHAMIIGLLKGCKPIPITFKRKLEVFEEEYCNKVNVDDVVNLLNEKYDEYASLIRSKLSI